MNQHFHYQAAPGHISGVFLSYDKRVHEAGCFRISFLSLEWEQLHCSCLRRRSRRASAGHDRREGTRARVPAGTRSKTPNVSAGASDARQAERRGISAVPSAKPRSGDGVMPSYALYFPVAKSVAFDAAISINAHLWGLSL